MIKSPRTSSPPTLVRLSAPLGLLVLSASQWPSGEVETGAPWWRFRWRQHSGPRSRILTDPIDQHPSALDTFLRLMNPGKWGSIFPEPRAAWRKHHSGGLVIVVFGLWWLWSTQINTQHLTAFSLSLLFQVVFQFSLKVQAYFTSFGVNIDTVALVCARIPVRRQTDWIWTLLLKT